VRIYSHALLAIDTAPERIRAYKRGPLDVLAPTFISGAM